MLMLLLTLAVFGFVVWLIVTYIPMPAPVRNVIVVIAVIILLLWFIRYAGMLKLPS
jgi:hypothetical protein